MDTVWNFITANLTLILIVLGIVLAFLLIFNKSVSGAVASAWKYVLAVIAFFAEALKEPEGNGGKTSFSRILGIYATIEIVAMSWVTLNDPTKEVPGAMMTLFWVTIGYAMLSKVFTTASPLLQQLIAAYLQKAQGFTAIPKAPDAPPAMTTTTVTTTAPQGAPAVAGAL